MDNKEKAQIILKHLEEELTIASYEEERVTRAILRALRAIENKN